MIRHLKVAGFSLLLLAVAAPASASLLTGGSFTDDDGNVHEATTDNKHAISIIGSPTATERGADGAYQVALTKQPGGTVTVTLAITSGTNEFTVNTDTLIFNKSNYSSPQTVHVTATDDHLIDGQTTGTIRHTASGGGYVTSDPQNVSVTINDDDQAGVVITESDGSTAVFEAGDPDLYTVRLTARPAANVTITLDYDKRQIDATPSSLTFTPSNWNVDQTVAVAGLDDGIKERTVVAAPISHTVASSDTDFNGLAVNSVLVNVTELLVTIDGPLFGAVGEPSTFRGVGNSAGVEYLWRVVELEGHTILPIQRTDSSFTFTPSVAGDYSIWVTIKVGTSTTSFFIDFTAFGDLIGNTFTSDILWLAEEGITKGCNPPANDKFCADSQVTRGQMAAFLVRALDLPAAPSAGFVDTVGTTFEADIDRLAAAGITKGCNQPVNDRYCPDDTVTRGQMAALLVRAMDYTDDGGGDLFTDDDGNIFETDIDRLATAGVTSGCNPPVDNRFCPNDAVTRGQMAAFLHRALGD